jgi:hypothetical protein
MGHDKISRRRFLGALAFASVGLVLAGSGIAYLARDRLRARYYDLGSEPPGTLEAPVLGTLMAATEAILGVPFQPDHYEDLFRWRAETLPGYRAVYERSAVLLNYVARDVSGVEFAQAALSVRQEILHAKLDFGSGGIGKMRALIFSRGWLLFDRYVVDQVLELFRHTDVWVLLGYKAWPGQALRFDIAAPQDRRSARTWPPRRRVG